MFSLFRSEVQETFMFIFSIVPINLKTDSDTQAVNTQDEVDVAEHRVMELEALLSSLIIKQYLGREISGVNNSSPTAVAAALEVARQRELELKLASGDTNTSDATARLTEMKRMQGWVDVRIRDLTSLYEALSTGTTLNYHVSGVINTDINMVANELYRALDYRALLSSSTNFWNTIVQANTQPPPTDDTTDNDDTTSDTSDNTEQTKNEEDIESQDERIGFLAQKKRDIANLQGLSNMLNADSLQTIINYEENLTQELNSELSKLKSFTSVNSPGYSTVIQAINELRSTLKSLGGQKVSAAINSKLQSSLSQVISIEINNINSFS